MAGVAGTTSPAGGGTLKEKLAGMSALLDEGLRDLVRGAQPVERLYQMMGYHLGWLDHELNPCRLAGGKRLRPALCMLAGEAAGGTAVDALPGALAVELVHNFSLVHDDIEDGSPLRRHRPAVWFLWGVAHGVNVGDGLLALAQVALLEGCERAGPATANRAAVLLGRACLALCEGRMLDLEPCPAGGGLDRYLAMIGGKTAALFGCAAELGALLGGAGDGAMGRMGEFGRTVGEAFQMQGDLLGVWPRSAVTGKPAADVQDRKRGLPAVIGMARASGTALAELRDLYARAEPPSDEETRWAVSLFERLGVREEAERMVDERLARAERLLDATVLSPRAGRHLRELVSLLAGRSA